MARATPGFSTPPCHHQWMLIIVVSHSKNPSDSSFWDRQLEVYDFPAWKLGGTYLIGLEGEGYRDAIPELEGWNQSNGLMDGLKIFPRDFFLKVTWNSPDDLRLEKLWIPHDPQYLPIGWMFFCTSLRCLQKLQLSIWPWCPCQAERVGFFWIFPGRLKWPEYLKDITITYSILPGSLLHKVPHWYLFVISVFFPWYLKDMKSRRNWSSDHYPLVLHCCGGRNPAAVGSWLKPFQSHEKCSVLQPPNLVGGLEYFLFSHVLGIIIPIDFHIFQRGGQTTNQKCY